MEGSTPFFRFWIAGGAFLGGVAIARFPDVCITRGTLVSRGMRRDAAIGGRIRPKKQAADRHWRFQLHHLSDTPILRFSLRKSGLQPIRVSGSGPHCWFSTMHLPCCGGLMGDPRVRRTAVLSEDSQDGRTQDE